MSKSALELIAKEKQEKTGSLSLFFEGLTELPKELLELTSLQSLDLSGNEISDITSLLPLIQLNKMEISLEKYKFGGKLNLDDNPITTPSLEIVKQLSIILPH